MKFTVKQGKHRFWPLYWSFWFPIIFRKRITRWVMFTFDSKYDLGDSDQYDVNKLFGVGSLFIHKNSERYGWRYNTLTNQFCLYAYYYLMGVRHTELITSVSANHWVRLDLVRAWNFTEWRVYRGGGIMSSLMRETRRRWISFLLGPWFGGNRTAPKKIELHLKKKHVQP